MAKYEHLPIYKKAFDLNVYFEKIIRNFSRYHKYTLGTEMREHARKIVKLIAKANSEKNKKELLLELRDKVEELKLVIRLCKELKVFNNFNSFQLSLNYVIDIAKQNEGWIKSLEYKK